MAEAKPAVNISENSPEHVAYKLLALVASAEKKRIVGLTPGDEVADRKYILDTYAQCLSVAKGRR